MTDGADETTRLFGDKVRAEKALSIRSARRVLERYLELWDQHRNMSNQQTHEIEEEVEASLVFHRTVLRAEQRRMFLDCQLMKRCFYDLANNRIMGLHLRRQIACRRSRLSYRLLSERFGNWKLYAVLHSGDTILTQQTNKLCAYLLRLSWLRCVAVAVGIWKEALLQRTKETMKAARRVLNVTQSAQQSKDALVPVCFDCLKNYWLPAPALGS